MTTRVHVVVRREVDTSSITSYLRSIGRGPALSLAKTFYCDFNCKILTFMLEINYIKNAISNQKLFVIIFDDGKILVANVQMNVN